MNRYHLAKQYYPAIYLQHIEPSPVFLSFIFLRCFTTIFNLVKVKTKQITTSIVKLHTIYGIASKNVCPCIATDTQNQKKNIDKVTNNINKIESTIIKVQNTLL